MPATRLTDSELRAMWACHGGRFHGPKVEHGNMPEGKLLRLLRRLTGLLPFPAIGDVVVRIDGSPLRSGANAYNSAVAVSLDPLVLVSRGGDMLWRGVDAREVVPHRRATAAEMDTALARYAREEKEGSI